MFSQDTGTPISFFDFFHNKSSITFFVQGYNFGDRSEAVSKDLFNTLKKDLAMLLILRQRPSHR